MLDENYLMSLPKLPSDNSPLFHYDRSPENCDSCGIRGIPKSLAGQQTDLAVTPVISDAVYKALTNCVFSFPKVDHAVNEERPGGSTSQTSYVSGSTVDVNVAGPSRRRGGGSVGSTSNAAIPPVQQSSSHRRGAVDAITASDRRIGIGGGGGATSVDWRTLLANADGGAAAVDGARILLQLNCYISSSTCVVNMQH